MPRRGRRPAGAKTPIARGRRPTFDALVAKYGNTPAGRDKAARIANYGATRQHRHEMAVKGSRTRKTRRR